MELWALALCLLPSIVAPITISSNGNSPEIKMIGGMMKDVPKELPPVTMKPVETTPKSIYGKRKLNNNSTKLSINERYRRLIPYMTFYYANDLITPTEGAKNIEVEKAEIIETKTIQHQDQRQPKKIVYTSNRNIPIYQGNRLTQYNIASANPTKYVYKEGANSQLNIKTVHYPPSSDHREQYNFEYERIVPKPIFKAPSAPFAPSSTRKPYLNYYNGDSPNIRYYIPEKAQPPKYKLVPYEQTPPVQVNSHNENIYHQVTKPLKQTPIIIHNEPVHIKQRPPRPHYVYESVLQQSSGIRKPAIVSENYYEKRRPLTFIDEPVIESGFKPITTEMPVYESSLQNTPNHNFEPENQQKFQVLEVPAQVPNVADMKPSYQYVVEEPTYKPAQYAQSNSVTLADLLNSLQLNKSIPKPLTRENVGTSIRTLLQVLNALKALPEQEDSPVLSTPKAYVQVTEKPDTQDKLTLNDEETDFHDEPYLSPVQTPSQHLDDFPVSVGSTSQRFPLPVTSDEEGGTPGRPGIDYPTLTVIPPTAFDCKTQRYKGFFADPETKCQVWHYCDLNGGQASFLCPNGTIFSQAGLTCDWWFNVRCASTTQLYVLNESLYKYILPHSPKFPEDYSGPLVDKYLTLKFKEMEEQFKKNKNKNSVSEKMDSDEESSTEDKESSSETMDSTGEDVVSEASVIVDSPGTSGNVERLQD